MEDTDPVEWITAAVERVIASYQKRGDDPSTKTVIFDFPIVTSGQKEVLQRKFAGRINLMLGLDGFALCHKPHAFLARKPQALT